MTEKANYTICNCKQVTYFDVEDALHNCQTFSDVAPRIPATGRRIPLTSNKAVPTRPIWDEESPKSVWMSSRSTLNI